MRAGFVLVAMALALGAAPSAAGHELVGDAGSVAGSIGAGASPGPCSDGKYKFLGPGARWKSNLGWRFRMSSVPSYMNGNDVLNVIKKSFRNVVDARNDCGLADNVSATQSYLGTTTRKPGISSNGTCTSSDGHNVVGFAPLGGYYSGFTCIWWVGNEIVEADMRLDTDTDWAVSLAGCNGELVMESLVTHEVGHAFGLGHVGESKHGRLTMSVYIDGLCENQEATLGRGDVLGLEALY